MEKENSFFHYIFVTLDSSTAPPAVFLLFENQIEDMLLVSNLLFKNFYDVKQGIKREGLRMGLTLQ